MSTDELIIQGLVTRRGTQAGQRYAQQTMRIYRQAVLNPAHFASTTQYRRAFVMSYLFYKHYLHTSIAPRSGGGAGSKQPVSPSSKPLSGFGSQDVDIEECERRIDEELAASFPASDPPSWTLGIPTASHRYH